MVAGLVHEVRCGGHCATNGRYPRVARRCRGRAVAAAMFGAMLPKKVKIDLKS